MSLAIGLGLTLWLLGGPRSVTASAIGGPFQLVDQAGQPVTDKNLKGKPTIIFFGFTHCPDVCSVDPERDTPQIMKDYLSSFDPNLKGLSGSPEATAEIISGYRVYAKKVPLKDGDYTMDHTALIYLMDRDGRFVAPFNIKRRPEEAAADLKRYL